jgi:hypothetical protein
VNKQVKLPVPVRDLLESTGFGDTDKPPLVVDFLQQVEPGVITADDFVLDSEFYGEFHYRTHF